MNDISKNLVQKHLFPAFVTPIVNYIWQEHKELNQQLLEYILSLAQTEAGLTRSNVGAWHSELDFFDREVECVQLLKNKLRAFSEQLLKEFYSPESLPNIRLEGWANVLGFGGYNTVHAHPNAAWSGVYYVTTNENLEQQPFSGKLELLDPRAATNLAYTDKSTLYGRFLLSPVAGQMLMFPAWLPHQVHPSFSKEPRVSIAMNILLSFVSD